MLSPGNAVFTSPSLDAVRKISSEPGIDLLKGNTLDEAFDNYSRLLQSSSQVRTAQFKKTGPEKYMLNFDGCIYAKPIHAPLKPRIRPPDTPE